MAEPLSPRIIERLEQIIRTIHVSEMDEAVHRELMGHMQDKLLGYLDIMLPMGLVKYAELSTCVYPIAVVLLTFFYAILYIPAAAVIRNTRRASAIVESIA